MSLNFLIFSKTSSLPPHFSFGLVSDRPRPFSACRNPPGLSTRFYPGLSLHFLVARCSRPGFAFVDKWTGAAIRTLQSGQPAISLCLKKVQALKGSVFSEPGVDSFVSPAPLFTVKANKRKAWGGACFLGGAPSIFGGARFKLGRSGCPFGKKGPAESHAGTILTSHAFSAAWKKRK